MTEVAAWFLYSLVVANLLGLAAVAGESALRDSGKPGRWAWVGAMVSSVALPLLAWLGVSLRSVPVVPEAALIPLAPLVPLTVSVGGVVAPAGPGVDQVLLVGWLVLTAGLGAYLVLSWASIIRDRRNWRRASVGGIRVAVTPDTGPAAWGIRHPEILLPEWAIELESRVRRLMLLHEGEHVRAGDTRVVLLGLILLAAAPWNIPLWWQFRRLRQAIELDCDARVLRRAPDARRYGTLLLEVGRRRSAPVLVVALADPPTFLERRIRLITAKARMGSVRRVGGLALVAGSLVALAIFTRDPMAAEIVATDALAATLVDEPAAVPTSTSAASRPADAAAGRDGSVGGGDVEVLIDAPAVREAGGDEPPSGAAGEPTVRPVRDEEPAAGGGGTRVAGASAIDVEARVGRMLQAPDGSPEALLSEATVRRQASVTVAGTPAVATVLEPPAGQVVESPGPQATGPGRDANGAGAGEYTMEPRIRNVAEIQTLIEREYPPLLRDAAIGGVANVLFLIGADGSVERTQLAEGTGHPTLDQAAMRVASKVRFSPALNRGEATAVWVKLPIAFVSR